MTINKSSKSSEKAVLRDKKYLQFLMDVYLQTCKGYTKPSLSQIIINHKVDRASVLALVTSGLLTKTNENLYFWKGSAPTHDTSEKFQEKVFKVKATAATNLRLKLIPVNKKGKALVPIIKKTPTGKKRIKSGAPQRYLNLLNYLFINLRTPGKLDLHKVQRNFQVSQGACYEVRKMGLLTNKDSTGNILWIGETPTILMATTILKRVNERVRESTQVKGTKLTTPETEDNGIPERFRHLLEKVPELPTKLFHESQKSRFVKMPTPFPNTPIVIAKKEETIHTFMRDVVLPKALIDLKEKNLKKSIAFKLIALGEFERADKLLEEIL